LASKPNIVKLRKGFLNKCPTHVHYLLSLWCNNVNVNGGNTFQTITNKHAACKKALILTGKSHSRRMMTQRLLSN